MKAFLASRWGLWILLVFLLGLQALFMEWSDAVSAPPVRTQITLSPRGTVETPIRVIVPGSHRLELAFAREGQDIRQMEKLLGIATYRKGELITPPIAVPIRWSLVDSGTGVVTASGQGDSSLAARSGAVEIYQKVESVSIPSGNYTFKAEILRDVPELAHLKTSLVMALNSMPVTPWQVTLVWWGMLAINFIVRPVMLLIGVILLVRMASNLARKKPH